MISHRKLFTAIASLAATIGGFAGHAAPTKADFSASLVVAGSDVRDARTAWVGLEVKLGPGWHTYWRSPGDAGAAPGFDWSNSRNVQATTIEWPAPKRFSEAGLDTFGYADHVLFPIKVRIKDPDAPAHLHLDATLYVCAQICTSNLLHFDADLTPGFRNSISQIAIDEWRARVPRATSPTIKIGNIDLVRNPSPSLRLHAVASPPLQRPDVFLSGDDQVTAGRPHVHAEADGSATIDLPLQGLKGKPPDKPLTVTLVDGQRSIEVPLPDRLFGHADTLSKTAAVGAGSTTETLPMIAVALLGGLILNFMPCVFPVLSLKLFSLSGYGTRNPEAIRKGLLATAAGVLVSFMSLAGALAGLKLAGAQVGWGLQFQQPVFLIVMAAILAAMTANLLGLFEIRLPWRLATKLDQTTHGPSLAAQFFNGFVMTALATPCSAPFVGTAVAFALSQATAQILLIFGGLGLGMASPYLALAAIPQLAFLFPRPGRWMLIVRQIAAAAIGATAIWLLSVLADVAGMETALLVGGGLGFLICAAATFRRRFFTATAIAAVIGTACGALIVLNSGVAASMIASHDAIKWQPLVPKDVQAMTSDGRTVFVDVGAAWCLTCKVNERLIIDSKPIRNRLEHDVVPVQGDFTKPNDEMAAYLRSFGRYGLPFNVVFGPGAPHGIVLPELLTEDVVLKAFDVASQQSSLP